MRLPRHTVRRMNDDDDVIGQLCRHRDSPYATALFFIGAAKELPWRDAQRSMFLLSAQDPQVCQQSLLF